MNTDEALLNLLWQISWQAGAIAILVLLLQQALGRAISGRWRHAMWMLVLLRLLLPVLPHSRLSVFSIASLLPRMTDAHQTTTNLPPPSTTVRVLLVGSPHSETPSPIAIQSPAIPQPTPIWQRSATLMLVWLSIAVALFVFRIIVNLRFHRRLNREHQPVPSRLIELLDQARRQMRISRTPTLVLTRLIDAPAVIGLFRSRILLPVQSASQLDDDELNLILLHELSHIACFDVAIDWLWAVLQSLHWFNPVLWLITPIRRNDRELARDEMVLSIAGKTQAPRYGQLLIALAQPARLPMFCPGLIGMLTAKKRLQRRIKMIARFNGSRWHATCAGLGLMIIAGCCLLTAPPAAAPKSPATQPSAATTKPHAETTSIADENADLPDEPITEKDRLTLQKLDQPIKVQMRFDANKLNDVIDYLGDTTSTNIYVDWPALERAGISRDAPVTARLRDIKFAKALELVFKSVEGEGDRRLGYTIDEGTITISTRKELDKNTVTRKYDINDLVFVPPDYSSAPDQIGIDATKASPAMTSVVSTQPDRMSRVDDIKKYITDNVEPASWKDNGGETGSISSSPLRAVLLITQTPRAHRKVQAVLDSLRQSRSLQVSIESRNLCLTDTIERKLPENLRNHLAAVRNAGRFRRDQFLTEAEVRQLIQAVQGDQGATMLTAPRLTLFNGQTAVLVVATQQAYVGDMIKSHEVGNPIWHYEPVTKTTTATGVTLKVTACASPDGGTVFVDLHDQVARLLKLIPEQYGPDPPGPPAPSAGKIQRPVLASFKVDAACGIPDKTTLLLGGVRQVDSGDPKFNADSPDRPASNAEVEKIRSENHQHEYLLIKPVILIRK